jgi:hypothetical protein
MLTYLIDNLVTADYIFPAEEYIKTAMSKRSFHILVIAVLALNLSGAAALTYAADCGMECCKPADWAGTISFEAPSCCEMDGVTCGFETGRFEDLFATVITRFNTTGSANHLSNNFSVVVSSYAPAYSRTHAPAFNSSGSPPTASIFLSNAVILC